MFKTLFEIKRKVRLLVVVCCTEFNCPLQRKRGPKKISRSNYQKKNNFARAVLYISFCRCVARIQRETSENFLVTRVMEEILGTLRSEDGYGRENVAEKVNSCSFNLHRDYSNSLAFSNVGEPS